MSDAKTREAFGRLVQVSAQEDDEAPLLHLTPAALAFAAISEEIARLHDAGVSAMRRGDLDMVARCADEARALEGEMVRWGLVALREASAGG